MKTLRTIALLSVLASLLLVTAASAQSPTIGVYFGPDKVSSTQVIPNRTFKIWITLTNINDTVNAVQYKLNLPSNVVVLSYDYFGERSVVLGSTAWGVAIGLGECVPMFEGGQYGQELVVAELTGLPLTQFSSQPVTITPYLGNPQSPSTAPLYSNCQGQLTNLTSSNGTLYSSVDTQSESFGAIKALY